MLNKKISTWWLVWAFLLGLIAVAWIYSVKSGQEVCLYDAKSGTHLCLAHGAFYTETWMISDRPFSDRFELSRSLAGEKITGADFVLPLWIPFVVALFVIPAARGRIYFRRMQANRNRTRTLCLRCGYDLRSNESGRCPKCGYHATRLITAASPEDLALPCPKCQYDLRSLGDGRCPECGAPFRVDDLTPEQPGLVLESWIQEAQSVGKKAMLPLVIAFSPHRAFRRWCRLEKTLTTSMTQVLVWILVWYVLLMIIHVSAYYGLNALQDLGLMGGTGRHQGLHGRFRLVAKYLPVHLLVAWMQCLVVSLIGMVIAMRCLSMRQLVRLATCLLAFTLLGRLFIILHDHVLYRALVPVLLDFGANELVYHMNNHLAAWASDVLLGLVGGFAVGTMLQKRRWLIALVSATVLVAAFPVYLTIERAYSVSVYEPARELLVGPRPPRQPQPGPIVLLGPTFIAGAVDLTLAGAWSIQYDQEEQASAKLIFDSTGALVSWAPGQNVSSTVPEMIADGQQHDMELPEDAPDDLEVPYRVLSGGRRNDEHVLIHLRREYTYIQGVMSNLDVAEETLTGTIDTDGTTIIGTSTWIREMPCVNFEPAKLERSFVMTRLGTTGHEQGP